ncbi:hypothetical protein CCACVL1_04605 [Corchorus capsularis]|uniref:Uncharacterized protein n=1 Tax=Corchorus capsularis TaxID=210143 RepID=A0A1R3JRD2_COCAP|nr:hypothetical protein CCACVL1_04605 [Corchorus capsularis]
MARVRKAVCSTTAGLNGGGLIHTTPSQAL